jgi:hypothetical protein
MATDPTDALAAALATVFAVPERATEWDPEARDVAEALAVQGVHLVNRDTLAAAWDEHRIATEDQPHYCNPTLCLDAILAEIAAAYATAGEEEA